MKPYEYEEYDKHHRKEMQKNNLIHEGRISEDNSKLEYPTSDREDLVGFKWNRFDKGERDRVNAGLYGKPREYLPVNLIALSETENPESDDDDYFTAEVDPVIRERIILDQIRKVQKKQAIAVGSIFALVLLL